MESSKENLSWYYKLSRHPYFAVLLSALLLILSFPPFPTGIFAFLGFVPLLILADTRKPTFGYVYMAFLLWNWGCGYWIGFTGFGVEEDEQVIAFTTGILANFANAFLMTLPFMGYTRLRRIIHKSTLPIRYQLIFSYSGLLLFWLMFEYLHFHWDLSWSWYTLGHALSYYKTLIQYYEITGVLGGSAHILLVNIVIYEIFRRRAMSPTWNRKKWLAGGLCFVLIPYGVSFILLNPKRMVYQPSGSLNVRIIQPNIDPFMKFDVLTPEEQVKLFVSLAEKPGVDTIDLVVLPETAVPRYFWRNEIETARLIKPLKTLADTQKLAVLTGIVEARQYHTPEPPTVTARKYNEGFYDMYNAAALLSPSYPVQTFEKGLFVPFVERTPFIETFPFMKKMMVEIGGGYGGYAKPDSIAPMKISENARIGSMICFESGYGDYIRKLSLKGANLLAIITNDGWWKKTSGHLQHAQFTTFRAIENRREIVRSANTGISLFADVKGNLTHKTLYWERTFVDKKVKLYNGTTFYMKYGDYIGIIASLLSLILATYGIGLRLKPQAKPAIEQSPTF